MTSTGGCEAIKSHAFFADFDWKALEVRRSLQISQWTRWFSALFLFCESNGSVLKRVLNLDLIFDVVVQIMLIFI